MEAILTSVPPEEFAIMEMDRMVLEAAQSAIVRAFTEYRVTSFTLDLGALAGLRALTWPFNLSQITKKVVRKLIAEQLVQICTRLAICWQQVSGAEKTLNKDHGTG